MADWTDEYLTMIEDCEARESKMTEWEQEFMDSLRKQIEKGRRPSVKQVEVLDRVWEKVTSKG